MVSKPVGLAHGKVQQSPTYYADTRQDNEHGWITEYSRQPPTNQGSNRRDNTGDGAGKADRWGGFPHWLIHILERSQQSSSARNFYSGREKAHPAGKTGSIQAVDQKIPAVILCDFDPDGRVILN
ncbi:MAG TPA: hypothetical protein PKG95_08510 [Anaerolineaceae bacterium]|nr:hypothetical protein [Anaerolineaceae bacterium]